MENLARLGVPRVSWGFVLPTGYSFNLDGTTLYLSLAAIFVAQAAGHPIANFSTGWEQQLLMVWHPHAYVKRRCRRATRVLGYPDRELLIIGLPGRGRACSYSVSTSLWTWPGR